MLQEHEKTERIAIDSGVICSWAESLPENHVGSTGKERYALASGTEPGAF